MRVDNSARSGGIIRISLIFYNMKVYCVFALESPMSTHNIPFFNIKKKNIINYPKSGAMGFFQGTQYRVRKSRGKRAISVRAIKVLLYLVKKDVSKIQKNANLFKEKQSDKSYTSSSQINLNARPSNLQN